MYYFSYGANMSEKELSKFTSYKFISYGTIKDYVVRFRKILNHPRKSGVATIEPYKHKVVHGKIYWIDNTSLLDKKEGFLENPKIYNKHYMNVNGYNCMLYILNPDRSGPIRKPRLSYKKEYDTIYMKKPTKKTKGLKQNTRRKMKPTKKTKGPKQNTRRKMKPTKKTKGLKQNTQRKMKPTKKTKGLKQNTRRKMKPTKKTSGMPPLGHHFNQSFMNGSNNNLDPLQNNTHFMNGSNNENRWRNGNYENENGLSQNNNGEWNQRNAWQNGNNYDGTENENNANENGTENETNANENGTENETNANENGSGNTASYGSNNENAENDDFDEDLLGEVYEEYKLDENDIEEETEKLDENDIEEETELKDLVDESTAKKGTYCYAASSLSNISENIAAIENEICEINKTYLNLLKGQVLQAYDVQRNRGKNGLYRSETQNKWYEAFKQIYVFQRYQERDLLQAMRYMISSSIDPNMNDLSTIQDAPKQIKRLIEEYAYKIISGHFTKASIGYAIYNFGRTYQAISTQAPQDKAPQEYIYLEQCLNILQCAITTINIELQKRWSSFVQVDMDHSSYVLSGGNIFFVFAGVLCYLYNGEAEYPMLLSIKNKVKAYLEYLRLSEDFDVLLKELFETPEFTNALQSILQNPSDIDCLYLPRNKEYVTHTNSLEPTIAHNINQLSAAVLRSMLNTAHSNPKDPVSYLFPFLGSYKEGTWGKGAIYITNKSLDAEDRTRLDSIADMKQFVGFRQTSSYIDELPIYLNRMKQGYYPYNKNEDPSSIGIRCIEDEKTRKEYMTKYGECIDLSIGSTKNELYNKKHDFYLEGKYYSMENLSHELQYIADHTDDDKSSKRVVRQTFLQLLQTSRYSRIFDFILITIFEHIHTKDRTLYGYPCPMFDDPYHQIKHDII